MISKYAAGESYLKVSLPYSNNSIQLIPKYQSKEYLTGGPDEFNEIFRKTFSDTLEISRANLKMENNYQNNSPPLYYWVTGFVFKLIGIKSSSGITKLYFLRFFSGLIAIICFIAFVVCIRNLFDTKTAIGSAVIFLCFPQPVWFFLNNDILSPLLVSVSIFLAWKFKKKQLIFSGILMGLAIWNKLSNLVFIPIPIFMILIQNMDIRNKLLLTTRYGFVTIITAIPLFASNLLYTNTFTANAQKMEVLLWEQNTIEGVITHPVWSIWGVKVLSIFSGLSFLRGEITWNLHPITTSFQDNILLGLVLGVILNALLSFSKQKNVSVIILSSFLLGMFFLIYLSVAFDYTHAFYPSKTLPFFFSGRILVGIFPMYILGMYLLADSIALRFNIHTYWLIIPLATLLLTIELTYPAGIIQSPFNLFSKISF
ncbi:MAG: ArnT family glycosyltransferase [Salibacteraceae bacterium]